MRGPTMDIPSNEFPDVLIIVRKVPDECKCEYTHRANHWGKGQYMYPTIPRLLLCPHGHLGNVVRRELLNGEEYIANGKT